MSGSVKSIRPLDDSGVKRPPIAIVELHLTRRSGLGLLMLVVACVSAGLVHGQTSEDAKKHGLREVGLGALRAQSAIPISRARHKCLVLPPVSEGDDIV